MRALFRSKAEAEVVLDSVEVVDDEEVALSEGEFELEEVEVEEVSSSSEVPAFPLVAPPPVIEPPVVLLEISKVLFPTKT